MTTRPTLALLTDFGTRDPYVAMMKGVMLSISPDVNFVDLTHDIAPGDIGAAAFWLEQSRPFLPSGSIVLCVVDPTVGTERRALCAQIEDKAFVGPDNGIFNDLLRSAQRRSARVDVVELDTAQLAPLPHTARGSTFHGRDLFAPAAARLAQGRRPVDLGWPTSGEDVVRVSGGLDLPHSVTVAGNPACVRVADHFGNLITDFLWASEDDPGVILSGSRLPWVRTYAEAEPDRLVALRGSFDTVELAMRGQSALKYLMA